MKRLVLLLVVALLALPSLALAGGFGGFPSCPDPTPTDPASVSQTFQAYGELTGSYSVGGAAVDANFNTVDSRVKTVDCLANGVLCGHWCVNPCL